MESPVAAPGPDRFAHEYAGVSEWRRIGAVDKAANISSLCRSVSHANVLDIGAGEGSVLARLVETGFTARVSALELSASGVDAIRARSIPGLEHCDRFDGTRIAHADASFDLAVLSHVLEHAENPRGLLCEAARVASYVFVEVPLEDTLRLPRDYTADALGHVNFYTRKSLRRFAQTCDLEVEGEQVTNRSRASYAYHEGWRGAAKWALKEAALWLAPPVAQRVWTYHGAILCRRRP